MHLQIAMQEKSGVLLEILNELRRDFGEVSSTYHYEEVINKQDILEEAQE